MVSQRLDQIELSGIRKMFEMAGKDAVMLGLGEPDFQPPEHVIEAFKRALDEGKNKYGPTMGLPELREAIAQRLHRWRDDVDVSNVLVTVSATEALLLSCLGLFEEGQEVLIPDPGFVLYGPHVTLAGAKPVHYSLKPENGFLPDQDELLSLVNRNTAGIIVNTPSNPTGAVFPPETVKMVGDIAEDNDLITISDEVYDEIVYDRKHTSFLGTSEKQIYINSFSKTYAMTGWRMGYLATSNELIKNFAKLHYYIVACPPTPIQHAALAALQGPRDPVDNMVKEFRKRKDVIVDELNKIPGLKCVEPNGAFYVFPGFDAKMSSSDMAIKLLEGGVLSTPGSAFGPGGEGHIRFSYANSLENLKLGMERTARVMESIKTKEGENEG